MVVDRIFGLLKIDSYDVMPIDEQCNGPEISDRPKIRGLTISDRHIPEFPSSNSAWPERHLQHALHCGKGWHCGSLLLVVLWEQITQV